MFLGIIEFFYLHISFPPISVKNNTHQNLKFKKNEQSQLN